MVCRYAEERRAEHATVGEADSEVHAEEHEDEYVAFVDDIGGCDAAL